VKKEELIEKLQALPDGIEVVILDSTRNMMGSGWGATSDGVHSEFGVSLEENDNEIEENLPPFIALSFVCPLLTEEYDEKCAKLEDDEEE